MSPRLILWPLFAALLLASAADGDLAVPRMAKEQLKPLLGSPDVLVLDLRVEPVWRASSSKIAGSVREQPSGIESWTRRYPKEKTYVLYCS